MPDAVEWEQTAIAKRPWRANFFARFEHEIAALPSTASSPKKRILELGSGPGFLAKHLLEALPNLSYVMLDFSMAMHQLAKTRLDELAQRTEFVRRSFKETEWPEGLGLFDGVVTMQAVHELRHKRYATDLHRQVRSVLAPRACYLVCDHYCGDGGMANDRLFMNVMEQDEALRAAGFFEVELLLKMGGLTLYRARK